MRIGIICKNRSQSSGRLKGTERPSKRGGSSAFREFRGFHIAILSAKGSLLQRVIAPANYHIQADTAVKKGPKSQSPSKSIWMLLCAAITRIKGIPTDGYSFRLGKIFSGKKITTGLRQRRGFFFSPPHTTRLESNVPLCTCMCTYICRREYLYMNIHV